MNDHFLENTAEDSTTQSHCVSPIANPGAIPPSPNTNDPFADKAPAQRPGVSNRTLREHGIKLLSSGPLGSRLQIPYFKPREETARRTPIRDGHLDFYRERILNPASNQNKYHQPKRTVSHAYFPNGSFDMINEQGSLIVTEGEFKALSLVEAGYPAVAIGGIHNFAVGDSLVSEIEFLLDQCEPRIAFLGDADTALNPQFAHAALKFYKLVSAKHPRTIFTLPRMRLSDMKLMKGIDDARSVLGVDFAPYFEDILKSGMLLEHRITKEDLAFELIEREKNGLNDLVQGCDEKLRKEILKRMARIANASGPVHFESIAQMVVEAGLVKKVAQFKLVQKDEARKSAESYEEDAQKKEVEMHYCSKGAKNYLYRTSDGSYTTVDRRAATNHLVKCGFLSKINNTAALSETDAYLTALESKPIDWVGSLAGRKAGLHTVNKKRILVTTSPSLLPPAKGEYPVIRAFVSGLFDYDPATDQSPLKQVEEAVHQSAVFFSWLSLAVKDLYDGGTFCPAQALVIAGPKRVGKNVCQDIITECLGGRQASPFSAMVGETSFNGELLSAEHWMIADEQHGSGYAEKQKLQSSIKKFCVNKNLPFNAKYSEAVSLDPYRRLTISLNDDEESLKVLPNLSQNSSDKLMILQAFGKPFHGAGTSFCSFDDWWKAVMRELPAFIYDLINDFTIPVELQDRHYRVISYHNADLVEALQSTRPETAFAEIALRHLVPCFQIAGDEPWRGTARELIAALRDRGCREIDSNSHFSNPYHVGRYLVALAESKPDKFHRVGVVDGLATYIIGPRPSPNAAPVAAPPVNFASQLPPSGIVTRAEDLPPPPPP